MHNFKQKISKLLPIARIKQNQLAALSLELSQMEQRKNALDLSLEETQGLYLHKAETLNTLRSSHDRQGAETCASAVDFYKAKWVQIYKEKMALEGHIRKKINEVRSANAQAKAVEKLIDRYREGYRQWLNKKDQEAMDEAFNMRHVKG